MTPQERAERIDELQKRCSSDIKFLLSELAAADAREAKIRELHRPFAIYDECDHDHVLGDVGVVSIDEIGLTCAKMYDICRNCCMNDDYQREECVDYHTHKLGEPICETIAILDGDSSGE